MYRRTSVARRLGVGVMAVAAMLFVPPLRNLLSLGYMPGLWRDVSTLQLIKVHLQSHSSSVAALSPCTVPAPASSDLAGHRDLMKMQLLSGDPISKPQPRPHYEEVHSKAVQWLNQLTQRKERYSNFSPRLSPTDRAQLQVTWRVVHEALTLHDIRHFLIYGTLLGAFRHGGIIPWDDDFDVAVDGSDVDKVRRVLSCIPGFTLRVQPNMLWKFFANDARIVDASSQSRIQNTTELAESDKPGYALDFRPLEDVVMRFPFVDIFLLATDGSYLWTMARFAIEANLFRVEDVYPLTEVEFEGELAPVPRRSVHLLSRMFHPNVCVSPAHDHTKGQEITDITVVPCAELSEMYKLFVV